MDIYNVYDNEKWQFTIETICKIINANLPIAFESIRKQIIDELWLNDMPLKKIEKKEAFQILFLSSKIKIDDSKFKKIIDNEKIKLVSEQELYYKNNLVNSIITNDVTKAWCKIGEYMKTAFQMPTIGITGSIGKTTTVRFAQNVFNERYKVFVSGYNRNVPGLVVRKMMQDYGPTFNFHIQEVGGGDIGRVESMASFLDTDAFGITGIEAMHHLDKYKTTQNLIYDKTSFDRYGKENQIGVLNGDDEILMSQNYESKIVTYGIKNLNADYVGKNIHQKGDYLEFDVDDHHNELTHIKIQIPGVHNVYNALMVFALAKHFGMKNEDIKQGFLKYRSSGIRQSIKNIAGRTFYIDCFNVCQASIKSCCETLSAIETNVENRRIAILGGENALGDFSYSVNYETGKMLAQYNNIDEFVFVGLKQDATEMQKDYYGNGQALYEGARSIELLKNRSIFLTDLNELSNYLKHNTVPGDIILLKGIYRLLLFVAIDLAFGTSYLSRNINFKPTETIHINIEGQYYALLGGIVLTKAIMDTDRFSLPEYISNKKTVRIGANLFKDSNLKYIYIPNSIKSIGSCAFLNSGLIELDLPESVLNIEYGAFARCNNLMNANLCNVETIGGSAFKNCKNIKKIILSDNTKSISDDAFQGCDKLEIIAPENSYAHKFAISHGIPVQSINIIPGDKEKIPNC